MAEILYGRRTANVDEPFVVFLIGMRINRFLGIRRWLPTFVAMFPMLRELYAHPEKGFLGAEFYFSLRGPMIIQYWRSFDDLERFARNPEDPHLPAWRRFNRGANKSGSVGIWHETYSVGPGGYEALYADMPGFGLARATESVPVGRGTDNARSRMGRRESSEKGNERS